MDDKTSFTKTLRDQLPKVKPVVDNLIEERVCITESDMCRSLAQYLYEAVLATSPSAERAFERNQVGLDDVEACVRYVVRKRIEQVAQIRPRYEYKEIEFPMCLYPLVDTFGRVEDYEGGLVIKPEQLDAGQKPEKYDILMTLLKTHRFPVTKGLPVVVVADNELFYRLAISEDGDILAMCDGNDVDPATVLVRCFYTMPMMLLFGKPRYSLGPVSAQKSAFSLLVRLGQKE